MINLANDNKLFDILNKLDIHYKTLEHKPIKTMEEGKEIMKKLEGNICINLFLQDNDNNFYIAIKKMDKNRLNLKKLEKILKKDKIKMASQKQMINKLGISKGCLSIFAIVNDKDIIILIDNNIPKNEKVNFHPLRNNATTTITFNDMIKFIKYCNNKIEYF